MNGPWPPAKLSALVFLHAESLSMTYIGRLMGISRDSVTKEMKRWGLKPCIATSVKLGNSIKWSADQEALVTRLWSEGASYTKIALDLGVSRSALQSKTKRLGLPPRIKSAVTPKPDNHRRAPVSVSSVTLQTQGHSDLPKIPANHGGGIIYSIKSRMNHPGFPKEHISKIGPSDTQCAVSLLDVQPWHCRFPIGTEPLASGFYCGQPICKGSYCKQHADIAYRPPQYSSATRPSWGRR